MSTNDIKVEYSTRVKRVMAVAANEEPDRLPIMPVMLPFAVNYYGYSMAKLTYNYLL